MSADPVSRKIRRALTGLGVTQIIGWGATYYLLTILALPISRDLQMPLGLVAGGMSTMMIISALTGPYTGRLMDIHGGSPVMAAGSVIASIGLMFLSFSQSAVTFFGAWTVIGLSSSMILYPAAFTALTQIAPERARRSITFLTLPGGLASTVFWPLTTYLLAQYGWRMTCQIYAALQILVCLPVHLFAIPPGGTRNEPVEAAPAALPGLPAEMRPRAFVFLTLVLALNSLLVTGTLNQFTTLLTSLSLPQQTVVLCSMLFGISQVSARVVEMIGGGSYDPVRGMLLVLCGFWLSVLCLAMSAPLPAGGIAFAVVFGACNGLFTINRSALVLHIFGSHGFGHMSGKVAVAQGIAGAAAPVALATVMENAGGMGGVAFMIAVSTLSVVAMVALFRHARGV